VVYAVVKAGGRQHKVAVGDRFTVNRLVGEAGDSVTLPALLLVDGDTVTSDAQALAGVTVTGEIVGHGKGPKIRIHKFKNKTGYHKRQGPPSAADRRGRPRHHEGLTPTWHTRRAPRPPATAATRTRSASASSASAARS
jgi:large subunit ribosomal protein L21